MGWVYTHRDKGVTNKEWFEDEFKSIRILDCSTKGKVFYAAAQKRDDPDTVFGCVFLTDWVPRSHHNFGYKDQDETQGPCDHECPERILDLLTPTDSDYANEWRRKCRDNAAAQKAKPKVKAGQLVEFAHALKFSDGSEQQRLRLVKGQTFRDEHGYRSFNLPRDWRQRYQYAVVA